MREELEKRKEQVKKLERERKKRKRQLMQEEEEKLKEQIQVQKHTSSYVYNLVILKDESKSLK